MTETRIKIKKLEALKENVTQFSDMWIIEMCDKTIAELKNGKEEFNMKDDDVIKVVGDLVFDENWRFIGVIDDTKLQSELIKYEKDTKKY